MKITLYIWTMFIILILLGHYRFVKQAIADIKEVNRLKPLIEQREMKKCHAKNTSWGITMEQAGEAISFLGQALYGNIKGIIHDNPYI